MREIRQQASAQGDLFGQGAGHSVESVRQFADFTAGIDLDCFPVTAGFQGGQRRTQLAEGHGDAAGQNIAGKKADQQNGAADPIQRPVDGIQKDLLRCARYGHHAPAGLLGGQVFAKMKLHLMIGKINQNKHCQQDGQKHQAGDPRSDAMHWRHRQTCTLPRIPSE